MMSGTPSENISQRRQIARLKKSATGSCRRGRASNGTCSKKANHIRFFRTQNRCYPTLARHTYGDKQQQQAITMTSTATTAQKGAQALCSLPPGRQRMCGPSLPIFVLEHGLGVERCRPLAFCIVSDFLDLRHNLLSVARRLVCSALLDLCEV